MNFQSLLKRSFPMYAAFACTLAIASTTDAQEPAAKKAPLPVMNEPIKGPNNETLQWPEVLMKDSATAEQQEKVVAALGRKFDDFTKESINAQIDIEKDKKSVSGGAFRIYNYCFVAYGTLDKLQQDDLLKNIFAGDGGGNANKDLGEVGDDKYSFSVEKGLMKRIRLETVLRSNDAKSDQSLFAGSIVVDKDPGEKEKSTWASVDTPDNKHPYLGMGVYTKATPLVAVPSALFFEVHLVFFEPEGWFNGKNLLGAKLPIMIQDQVRNLRRELAK